MTSFQPKAIIFDLLTALLDSWTLWNRAAGSPSLGLAWRKAYLELTFGSGKYQPYEDLVQRSAAQVGLDTSAPGYLLMHWDELAPWPEALGVLQQLKAKGMKLGVVTNCSDELGRKAAEFFAFDAVVTAEACGFYKPHAKPYANVLKMMGVEAYEALFVAGSSADVPGATAAGMQVVWHNRVGLEAKGDVKPLKEDGTLNGALGRWL